MEQVYLDCLIREEVGKNKVGALRRKEFVPAVVYGQEQKSLPIKCDRSQLIKFIHTHHGGENIVITLRISDGQSKGKALEQPVLIKEIQYHPVDDFILHIDFNQISLTKRIKTKIPIVTKGDSIGVKQDGGVLAQILWELEIECLPIEIPEKIEIEVTNLKIGDSLQVKDLHVPEGIKVVTDQEGIVVNVTHPKKLEDAAAAAEAAGAAPSEPEVIKEKKPEEGEEKGKEKAEDKGKEKSEEKGKEKAGEKKG